MQSQSSSKELKIKRLKTNQTDLPQELSQLLELSQTITDLFHSHKDSEFVLLNSLVLLEPEF